MKFRIFAFLLAVFFSGSSIADEISGYQPYETAQGALLLSDTRGMDRRQDRRGDRYDRRDDRRDCRQEEGVVGHDKRDCKQDARDGDDHNDEVHIDEELQDEVHLDDQDH